MHPKLITFNVPDFLQGLFPSTITIYWYGFLIAIGAILAISYTGYQAKKQYQLKFEDVNTLFLLLLVASIIGGKVFYFFEDPSYYISNIGELMSGKGFVFYGSFLFTIPVMWLFFKFHKLPIFGMLDIMGITTCIVHIFGRLGCFMAGCCHGKTWDGPLAVTFTDANSLASPLNSPLHPTQLYSATMIGIILIILLRIKKRQVFSGQIFISYIILYATGRALIEMFRGDISRGFIIDNYVSHSQSISLILIIVASWYYYKQHKKSQHEKRS
jgi:phosphatidylglycerol:prolipoprotein diacylglycerol transferase